MPRFSLVITTRNRAAALKEVVELLVKLDYPSIEVVVVDNASDDDTRTVAASLPVKYIYFPGGLSQARHIGSMAASGDYLAYVDDDCKPGHPQILREIQLAFEKNPQAGIIGSRIENVGFRGMQQFKGYTRFGPNAVLEFEPDPPRADVFASMAIAIRKDVYLEIGGFDPAFSRGCEEVDLCLKVKAAGYQLVYHPGSFFYHYEMGSHFRFNPVHNRDYMRLYSFFKFFTPTSGRAWTRFLANEWPLFANDVRQIRNQYAQPDYRSTHLPALNALLCRSRAARWLFRWPLMAGAVLVSPVLRRCFVPYIYFTAVKRKRAEAREFGLKYAS